MSPLALCSTAVALLIPSVPLWSPPGSAIATPGSSIGRPTVQAADSSIFPSTMIAESAAKAKIEAAKAATAAKLAESGTKSPELAAKEVKIDVPMGGSKDKDFNAEAMKIREQWMAIRDNAPGGTLSKSKSAQVAQLKIMEQQARGKAQAAKARAAEQAAAAANRSPLGDFKLPFS
mmetsp:Transcript_31669/g.105734  ORF Transcript_31669/g.105734 Transcript_31669/m.105734 type:complete len:176 (+) Transcript_31669:39-566(+)